jgi:hypothetical protein
MHKFLLGLGFVTAALGAVTFWYFLTVLIFLLD